jgi:hypothetical protein
MHSASPFSLFLLFICLFCLLLLCSNMSGDTTTDYPMCSTPLCLPSLQLNILSLLRDSDGIVSERDRATIRSALSFDTTTDYLLCFSAPSLMVNALMLHVLY